MATLIETLWWHLIHSMSEMSVIRFYVSNVPLWSNSPQKTTVNKMSGYKLTVKS